MNSTKFCTSLLIFYLIRPIKQLEKSDGTYIMPFGNAGCDLNPQWYEFHTEVNEMVVEPMGSVMSIQAQGAVQKQPTPVENDTANTATVQPAEKIDPMTSVVENAQGKSQYNTPDQGGAQQQVTNEQLKKAVEQMNKNRMSNSEAIFGIHEGTNRVTIKIVDKDTKKVIKELPPEKTLDMIAKVWELAGIMVDERR